MSLAGSTHSSAQQIQPVSQVAPPHVSLPPPAPPLSPPPPPDPPVAPPSSPVVAPPPSVSSPQPTAQPATNSAAIRIAAENVMAPAYQDAGRRVRFGHAAAAVVRTRSSRAWRSTGLGRQSDRPRPVARRRALEQAVQSTSRR